MKDFSRHTLALLKLHILLKRKNLISTILEFLLPILLAIIENYIIINIPDKESNYYLLFWFFLLMPLLYLNLCKYILTQGAKDVDQKHVQ